MSLSANRLFICHSLKTLGMGGGGSPLAHRLSPCTYDPVTCAEKCGIVLPLMPSLIKYCLFLQL